MTHAAIVWPFGAVKLLCQAWNERRSAVNVNEKRRIGGINCRMIAFPQPSALT